MNEITSTAEIAERDLEDLIVEAAEAAADRFAFQTAGAST